VEWPDELKTEPRQGQVRHGEFTPAAKNLAHKCNPAHRNKICKRLVQLPIFMGIYVRIGEKGTMVLNKAGLPSLRG
jgi:hypothetical protein